MWKELTLSPKGQITLPKDIREALELKPGDMVMLTVSNGRLIFSPKNVDFNSIANLLGTPPKGPATLEQIDETIANEAARAALAPIPKSRDQAA